MDALTIDGLLIGFKRLAVDKNRLALSQKVLYRVSHVRRAYAECKDSPYTNTPPQ
jgi:hypothetical protein